MGLQDRVVALERRTKVERTPIQSSARPAQDILRECWEEVERQTAEEARLSTRELLGRRRTELLNLESKPLATQSVIEQHFAEVVAEALREEIVDLEAAAEQAH